MQSFISYCESEEGTSCLLPIFFPWYSKIVLKLSMCSVDCWLISGLVCSFYISKDNFFSGILGGKLGVKVLNLLQKYGSVKLDTCLPSSFYEYLLTWSLIFIFSVFFFLPLWLKIWNGNKFFSQNVSAQYLVLIM